MKKAQTEKIILELFGMRLPIEFETLVEILPITYYMDADVVVSL